MSYIKHFSDRPENYQHFRPDYPDALFHHLADLVPERLLAWDCATGNGQAACSLAKYFTQVIGSDINQTQLDVAIKKDNIQYYCWPAEKTTLVDHSIDLITVAQALHWFNFNDFYREVHRVLKPGGIIAAWCYPLGQIIPPVDAIIRKLYEEILGDKYWPPERRYIDNAYQTIPFPFSLLATPNFSIIKDYNFSELIGYLNTWSAVKEYQKRNLQNPLDLIMKELKNAWGDMKQTHQMVWPLYVLVGRQ